jgi:hypothetical protein
MSMSDFEKTLLSLPQGSLVRFYKEEENYATDEKGDEIVTKSVVAKYVMRSGEGCVHDFIDTERGELDVSYLASQQGVKVIHIATLSLEELAVLRHPDILADLEVIRKVLVQDAPRSVPRNRERGSKITGKNAETLQGVLDRADERLGTTSTPQNQRAESSRITRDDLAGIPRADIEEN